MIEAWVRWWDDWEREAALKLAGALLLVGVAVGGWGWYARHSGLDFRRDARPASAEVVAEGFTVRQRHDSNGYPSPEVSYLPTVRFTTPARQQVAHQVACESRVRRQIGSRVDVLYDPADPRQVCVATDVRLSSSVGVIRLWAGAILAVLGCVVGVAGLIRR